MTQVPAWWKLSAEPESAPDSEQAWFVVVGSIDKAIGFADPPPDASTATSGFPIPTVVGNGPKVMV
jgi:hypothetical protein